MIIISKGFYNLSFREPQASQESSSCFLYAMVHGRYGALLVVARHLASLSGRRKSFWTNNEWRDEHRLQCSCFLAVNDYPYYFLETEEGDAEATSAES